MDKIGRLKISKNLFSGFFSSTRFYYGSLILFCLFAWAVYIYEWDLRMAYESFLPVVWVFRFAGQPNFLKDYLSSMELYDKSAFLHIYPLAYKYLGIAPTTLVYFVIGFEIAIIACAFFALTRTLLPKSSKYVPFLVVVLAIAGYARTMDWGRYYEPYFGGLYNNVPIALGIFSTAQFLKERFVWSGILLAGNFISHSIRGAIQAACLFAMQMAKPRQMLTRKFLLGALLFIVISVGWLILVYKPSQLVGSGLPEKFWYKFSKFSFHLYPVDLGLFTVNHGESFIPLLSFTLLLVFYLSRTRPLRIIDRKVVFGMAAIIFLTLLGIIFSVLQPNPTLVKLSLQRASELYITLALVYVVGGLWGEIDGPSANWRKIIAGLLIISPLFLQRGFPLFYSILLVSPAWIGVLKREGRQARNWIVALLVLFIFMVLVFYKMTGIPIDLRARAFTGGIFAFKRSLFRPILIFLFLFFAFRGIEAEKRIKYIIAFLLILSCLSWAWNFAMSKAEHKFKESYKEVQVWARRHTPVQALFMVDPLIYYGWREYSQRSSFGNLREWLHTSWIYTFDLGLYQEGLKRFQEFSINLSDYVGENPSLSDFEKMAGEVKRKYYSLGDGWRLDLSKRYGIDYFVLIKEDMQGRSALKVAFENKYFVVLKSGDFHKE